MQVKRLKPAPLWWRDASGMVVWGSLLLVTAMWAQNRGVQALQELESGLSSLGRITAMWSANLLLLQVALMARIPWVERAYGQDELARRHRLLGFTSFNLMLAHLFFTVLGLALLENKNFFAETWTIVTTYPDMILASAGTLMLILVVVTSIRAARSSMAYENWHVIHLYAYLGVALAIPHQLSTGTDFGAYSWMKTYWWGLFLATIAAVLLFRVLLPLHRSNKYRLRVADVIAEGPDVTSVIMTGRRLERLHAEGGQFFVWRFMTPRGWLRGHAYSLSEAPRGDRLRITVKALGTDSANLARLPRGTRVFFEGPYGRLTRQSRSRKKVTLIGAGIGITPMRALLEELPYAPGEASLIYRASSENDLILTQELDALAAVRGARVFYVTGPRNPDRNSWLPAAAHRWSDEAGLRRLGPDIDQHDVYLCGSGAWMDSMEKALTSAGVPGENIHTELFSW